MKKIKLMKMIVLFLIMIYGVCHAAEPKEPKLIKETKFADKVKKVSDNVVVTEKELIFLDAQGNIRKKKALPKYTDVEISKNGKRIGQQTAFDVTEKGPARTEFSMLDENGELLWTTSNLGGLVYISEARGGSVVQLLCSASGCGDEILFRDKDNAKGISARPVVGQKIETISGALSDDGNYFAAAIITYKGERGREYSESSDIVLFDITGKELWKKHFENERMFTVAVSPYGNFVVAEVKKYSTRESKVLIFNRQGDILLTQRVGFVGSYYLKFDKEEKVVVACSDNGELYFIETAGPSLQWKYLAGDENIVFTDADITTDYIAASVTTINPKNISDGSLPRYIYVFDSKGMLLLKKKIINHGYHAWRDGLSVKIGDKGKEISATLRYKIMKFENEFAK